MFKNLKSKIEDEARRLQATVSQYSRNEKSGSPTELGNYSRSIADETHSENLFGLRNDGPLMNFDDAKSVASEPAMKADLTKSLFKRTSSLKSIESDNSCSSIPQSSKLFAPEQSDVESCSDSNNELRSLKDSDLNFDCVKAAAVKYKDRHRQLCRRYRELLQKNRNYNESLTTFKEKTLKTIKMLKDERRILREKVNSLDQNLQVVEGTKAKNKKLQLLLEKCRDEIKTNRQQLQTLNADNQDWENKFVRQQEECIKRISSCEDNVSVVIAASKAEMHSTIQEKDQEIGKWIVKCRRLEEQVHDGKKHWELKKTEFENVIQVKERENLEFSDKCTKLIQDLQHLKETEERAKKSLEGEYNAKLADLEKHYQSVVKESTQKLYQPTNDSDKFANDQKLEGELKQRFAQLDNENRQLKDELKNLSSILGQSSLPSEKTVTLEGSVQGEPLQTFNPPFQESDSANTDQQANSSLPDEDANNEFVEQIKELEHSLETRTNELLESEALNAQKDTRIDQIQIDCDDLTKNVADLRKELLKYENLEQQYQSQIEKTEKYQALVEDLRSSLKGLESEKKEQQTQNEQYLQQAFDELQQQSEKAIQLSSLKTRYQDRIAELEELVNKSSDDNNALSSELNALKFQQSKFDSLAEEVQILRRENSELKKTRDEDVTSANNSSEIKENEDEIAKKDQEAKKLSSEVEALTEAFDKLDQQNKDFERQISESNLKLADVVKNSDKLSKENIDLIQSVETLEGKNTELQRNNDELSNLLSSLRKQYTEKDELLSKANSAQETINDQLNRLKEENDILRNNFAESEKKLNEAIRASDRLSDENKAMSESFSNSQKEHANEKDGLISQNEGLKNTISNLNSMLTENDKIVKSVDGFRVQIVEKDQKIQMLETNIDNLMNHLHKHEEEILKLSNHQVESTTKLDEALKTADKLSKERMELVGSVGKLEKELQESLRNMELLKEQSKKLSLDKDDLAAKLVKSEEDNAASLLEFKSATRKIKSIEEEKKSLAEAKSMLSKEIDEIRSTETALMNENDSLKNTLKSMKSEYQEQIGKLKKEEDEIRHNSVASLQSEIRQLYQDMNLKDQRLDVASKRIQDLEDEIKTVVAKNEGLKLWNVSLESGTDVDMEELQSLRKKLDDYEVEVSALQLKLSEQESRNSTRSPMMMQLSPNSSSREKNLHRKQTNTVNELNFAEPTEAEYLRNVLFRYMSGREILGKEIVVLARVIGTVVKFSPEQLETVIKHEEARFRLFGDTAVSHATTMVDSLIRRTSKRQLRRMDYDQM